MDDSRITFDASNGTVVIAIEETPSRILGFIPIPQMGKKHVLSRRVFNHFVNYIQEFGHPFNLLKDRQIKLRDDKNRAKALGLAAATVNCNSDDEALFFIHLSKRVFGKCNRGLDGFGTTSNQLLRVAHKFLSTNSVLLSDETFIICTQSKEPPRMFICKLMGVPKGVKFSWIDPTLKKLFPNAMEKQFFNRIYPSLEELEAGLRTMYKEGILIDTYDQV